MDLLNLIFQYLAREWIKSFKKSPIITAILSVIVGIVASTGIYYADKANKQHREAARLESLNYQTQIQQLEQTEKGIKQLLSFIEVQKQNIRESEDAVSSLKKEQEALKPIVESNKAVIEAIFKAQDQRNQENVWRERWIGFAFGIAASLVASFIWFVVRLWVGERKQA